MERDLESDRIGRIGERQFELFCEKAGLYCNRSSVDVMGWDYIVEFPMSSAHPEITLDRRQLKGARVQLKTTLGNQNNRVRLSLSAIDRLAKDPGPAIIVIFRLQADGEIQSGYIVHLIGRELARILRRLRMAEARRELDINHAEISYDYEKAGVRFAPTGAGLFDAISAACGNCTSSYTIEKQRQLAERGYEDGQIEIEALVHIDGPEHFGNLLLGLEPLRPRAYRAFDSRFGIRLPYRGSLLEYVKEFHLSPPTLGRCEISIRGPGFGRAARFGGQIFIAPPIAEVDGPQILFRTPAFRIRLTPVEFKFESVGSIDDLEQSIEEWAELLCALTLMMRGRATLTVAKIDSTASISVPIDEPITGPYLKEIPIFSSFVDGWIKLLTHAGLRSTAKIKFDSFWEANDARRAVDILLNPTPQARFEFRDLDIGESCSPLEGIYFDSASFAETNISFSAKVFFEKSGDPEWQYHSTRFEALDVRPKVEDVEEYGVDQAIALDLKILVNPKYLTLVPQQAATSADADGRHE